MIDVNLQGKAGAFELNVAFAVPSTGVTGIFGPSASGKTTLLRAIAGLTPMSGHVKIGDKVWQENGKSVPVHKRRVGMLFQEPSLFTHLNVLGNLEFAAKRHPASPINIADVVTQLSLKPLLLRSVGKLSGGERQRVALARALLSGPKVLLMDEPLSSLDEASKDEILTLISNVCNRYAVPALYVSHDRAEIARLTDSVLHMKGGRLIEPPTLNVAPSLLGLSGAEINALALKAILAGL